MRSRTRQSPSRLELLRKEVEAEARKLAEIQSEYSRLVSGNEVQRREAVRLTDEKLRLTAEIGALGAQLERLTTEYAGVAAQVGRCNEAIEEAEKAVGLLEARAQAVQEEIAGFEKACGTKKAEVGGISTELLARKNDLDALLSEKVSVEQAIVAGNKALVDIEAKRDRVQGMIEEAMTNFRIYEMRISQFSEDTGYIVGYTRPDLLNKE